MHGGPILKSAKMLADVLWEKKILKKWEKNTRRRINGKIKSKSKCKIETEERKSK
jgi:hypothetical protein